MAEMRRRRAALWAALWTALLGGLLCGGHPCVADTFRRGDANVDSAVDTSDAVTILLAIFSREVRPDCLDALDANDDGSVDLSDPVYALLFLFAGGASPSQPYPDCGDDPTPDGLDCATYSECVECESVAAAEAAIAALIPRVACVPEDAVSLELPPGIPFLVVTVCPASKATACGDDAVPGFAAGIQSVGVDLDLTPPRAISFNITGSAVDLPVDVAPIGAPNASSVCLVTLPFSVDGSLPLVVKSVGGDAVEVVALGAPVFDNIRIDDITATGGIICANLVTLQSLIRDELEAQAESIAASILGEAAAAVVGRVICLE